MSFLSRNTALVSIGETAEESVEGTLVVGDAVYESFEGIHPSGRRQDCVRVHVDEGTGIVRGMEVMAPGGEHAVPFLASLLQQEMRAQDMLELPFYPPSIEEGLRLALADALRRLDKTKRQPKRTATS